jgi:hypothetical protein
MFAGLENLNDAVNSATDNKKASATDSLNYCELIQLKPWLMKTAQNYYIKGSRLKCSSCRIQGKLMEIILTALRRKRI